MIRHDYSYDSIETEGMSSEEILDYDTKYHNWTGINFDRMRLPTRYDISKYYKRNIRNTERGQWKRKEEQLNFSKDFDWQITYSFPNTLRNPKTSAGSYGGRHVTFRRLYLILCEHFNEGRYFIDDYFETVYPNTVKPEVDASLNRIKMDLLDYASEELSGAIATKSGEFDLRYKVNRGMRAKRRRYEAFASAWEEAEGEYLAKMIKDDIINCMMSGQLQLACIMHDNSPETVRRRVRAGLSKEPVFFATAQLIESIQLYVKLGGNKKWRTKQGILV